MTIHPRAIRLCGVTVDVAYLLCAATAAWAFIPTLSSLGAERYWLAVACVAIALLPLSYLHHGDPSPTSPKTTNSTTPNRRLRTEFA